MKRHTYVFSVAVTTEEAFVDILSKLQHFCNIHVNLICRESHSFHYC